MRLALAVAVFLALVAPAWAHVTVVPDVARPGDTVELAFRVQNERTDATTTAVELFLPPGVPAKITGRPGWSSEDKGNGNIAFTPDTPDAAIPPGRTEDFKLTLGPLPAGDKVVVKALQTYADGEIVRWIQDSGPDDERPAAILDLSGSGGEAKGAWPLYVGGAFLLLLIVAAAVVVTRRRRRDI